MIIFWNKGPLFVKDLLVFYNEPKPHFNFVRALEEKGFLSHKTYGSTYQYYAVIDKEQYSKLSLTQVYQADDVIKVYPLFVIGNIFL